MFISTLYMFDIWYRYIRCTYTCMVWCTKVYIINYCACIQGCPRFPCWGAQMVWWCKTASHTPSLRTLVSGSICTLHTGTYSGLLKFGLFPQGMATYNGLFNSVFDLANQQGLLDGVPVRVYAMQPCVFLIIFFCFVFVFEFCWHVNLGLGRVLTNREEYVPWVPVWPRGLPRR